MEVGSLALRTKENHTAENTEMQTTFVLLGSTQAIFAQAKGDSAYFAGQIVGTIFLVVLAGAILWKLLGKKPARKRSKNLDDD
jgi:hypothetical protein